MMSPHDQERLAAFVDRFIVGAEIAPPFQAEAALADKSGPHNSAHSHPIIGTGHSYTKASITSLAGALGAAYACL